MNKRQIEILEALKEGRAFTAKELLKKLAISESDLKIDLAELESDHQIEILNNRTGKYYRLANFDFKNTDLPEYNAKGLKPTGMEYCRSCYRHLAGRVGVAFRQMLERKNYIVSVSEDYKLTDDGKDFVRKLGINPDEINELKPCLDFSERLPHLKGKLAEEILKAMFRTGMAERVGSGREIVVSNGENLLNCKLL